MTHTIHVASDASDATAQAAHALSQAIVDTISSNIPTLCLFSGGSAFSILNLLPIPADASVCTIGVLDERYTANPKESNFRQLVASDFCTRMLSAGASAIDTWPHSGESASELAIRFEYALRLWSTTHPDGRILITQGMGPDGHTSGMMPLPDDPEKFGELFDNEAHWVAAYDATGKNPYPSRVTTTCAFLRHVDTSIFLITGEEKRPAYTRLLTKHGDLTHTPARIVREMKSVLIFTDISI